MKKRQFLTPLAVSIAALLGRPVVPAQASPTPEATASDPTARAVAADHLILKRSGGNRMQLAQHESHSSHSSHVSHSSGN